MPSKRWRYLGGAALAALLLVIWGALAQEQEDELSDQPAAPGESLAEADADVIDATAEVAAAAAAQPPRPTPEAWPVADLTPPDLGPRQITIYRDGRALVRERRRIRLSVGENRVEIDGVARRLDPSSVRLRPLSAGGRFTVLEQQTAAPPVRSAALLDAAVGQKVRLRDGRYTVSGTLLAVEPEGVVIGTSKEIHIHPTGEVILPSPAGLPDTSPKVAWTLEAAEAGEVEAELSYLTDGLTWSADYALTTAANDRLVAFEGWLDVANETGVSFAGVGLIFADAPADATAAESPVRYYLPRRVDLPQGGAKRFALAQVPALRSTVRYVAALEPDGLSSLRLNAELVNDVAAGLGAPLPAGPVRLYAPDRVGRLELRGEQELAATAPDERLSFDLGPADDIDLRLETSDLPPDSDGRVGVRRVITFRNLRTEDVVVKLVEQRPGDWQVSASTHAFTPPTDGAASAEVPVPANAAAELRYELRLEPETPSAAEQT